MEDDLDKKLCDLLNDFYAKQEPLGDEFAQVIHENLWDLYEE